MIRARQLHPGSGGPGVRAASSPTTWASAHVIGVGQRHRRDHDRAAGDRRAAGRRGRGAVVHVLRVGRGGRHRRSAAGVLRRRPRHPQRHRARPSRPCSRHARKAIIAVDLFGSPGAVDELRELGVPVLEDAAQAAGASLGDRRGGRARRRGDVLVLPVQEPAAASATAARSRPTTTTSPSSRGRCASTGRATSRASSTWATTRALTSCRRRSCACCWPSSTTGARGRRAAADAYAQAGLWPITCACRR